MDWECEEPRAWIANGLPDGWTAEAARSGKSWPWQLVRASGGPRVEVHGVADSADDAKKSVADAFERLQLAFCTEKAQDWPYTLSLMLGAGEDAAKVAGMSDEQRNRFNGSCALARGVLERVPNSLPRLKSLPRRMEHCLGNDCADKVVCECTCPKCNP